jgi:hypothetical protein
MRHAWKAAAVAMTAVGIASADDAITLQEKATPGVQRHHRVTLTVNGKMSTEKGEQPLVGQAALQYPERVIEVDADGVPKKVLRYYAGARAKFMVAGEDVEHSLRPEVRMVVGERGESGCSMWSTGGPFTSDELEVVEDLLDVTRLPGLLPNKSVKPTEGWNVNPKVAQALCNLDSLVGAEITGTYKELKEGKAIVEIKGNAHGMQQGGEAKIKIEATLVYHVADAMIESLDWTQTDARAASPVAPAGNYKVRIEVKRDKSESPNLTDAAIANLDLTSKPESKLLLLEGPNKQYKFLHERDWHVTAARNNVVVMRCVRNNEFLGQLSIAVLNDRAPGVSLGTDDFIKIVENTNHMKMDPVEKIEDMKNPAGVALKRIATTGEAPSGQLKLAHRHYLATGTNGSQILFSFLCDPANVKKLDGADEGIVNTLEVMATQAATKPPQTTGR